jgi:hypothetical protein
VLDHSRAKQQIVVINRALPNRLDRLLNPFSASHITPADYEPFLPATIFFLFAASRHERSLLLIVLARLWLCVQGDSQPFEYLIL